MLRLVWVDLRRLCFSWRFVALVSAMVGLSLFLQILHYGDYEFAQLSAAAAERFGKPATFVGEYLGYSYLTMAELPPLCVLNECLRNNALAWLALPALSLRWLQVAMQDGYIDLRKCYGFSVREQLLAAALSALLFAAAALVATTLILGAFFVWWCIKGTNPDCFQLVSALAAKESLVFDFYPALWAPEYVRDIAFKLGEQLLPTMFVLAFVLLGSRAWLIYCLPGILYAYNNFMPLDYEQAPLICALTFALCAFAFGKVYVRGEAEGA